MLDWNTWKSHTRDHPGAERNNFIEYRENQLALIATLREPAQIRRIDEQFTSVFSIQGSIMWHWRTLAGNTVVTRMVLNVVVRTVDSRVASF